MGILRKLLRHRWPQWNSDWLLSHAERGNDATDLQPWTESNAVRTLIHGSEYFPRLVRQLHDVGEGDLVLLAGWRMDAEQLIDADLSVADALVRAAESGASVRGLLWRSHPSWLVGSWEKNKELAQMVNRAGGAILLDHRVRRFGSQHQKFIVIRRPADPGRDVAFVGGLDLARSRADDWDHGGDPLPRDFTDAYGSTPAWHDVHLQIRGPAVGQVEQVFRERWSDPQPMTLLPWHRHADQLSGLPQRPSALPAPTPPPPPVDGGGATVQLLRTYPHRRRTRAYPFAPQGEFSVARGFVKALQHARHLVYIEDQYLWSSEVGEVLDEALHRNPALHIIAVRPRHPDQEGLLKLPPSLLGRGLPIRALRPSVRDRLTVLDIEKADGAPIYVHAKVVIIDDVWASVGSANLNRRSWTHDSELSVAVLDGDTDSRHPIESATAAGPGDTAERPRRFARQLRLQLMREHLHRHEGDDADLIDPTQAAQVIRDSAEALDLWHEGGQVGSRPPGRLRRHDLQQGSAWQLALASPLYRTMFDPDGRPVRRRLTRRF
ncbi:phospholipase D family protein [Garicola koreensis]|uniref:Phosphatidylserine/phosphatidylglycerophosphate/ cardiolipin synthase-like enzyme n=1 Tax=Garicola koreensis TaxID=1262554 RepID=A0A7W5TPJ0_9MICC|nr:phospholipase D family protein [Garicola koreensis]MBB3666715.1 phosphatidylserine/phosphatidylglycerophosphate/cardiolipin synthase-like enzyme [Garicola koreensis]